MTKAAIYVRISSDKSREEVGVNRQIADCKELAKKQGWTVVEVISENDTSAFKRKRNKDGVLRVVRPGFSRMLQGFADQEFEAMVAYNIDRVARDLRDLEDLIDAVEDNGIKVRSVGGEMDLSTTSGITMARIMVTMGNQESKNTSRRVVRAKLDTAMAGEFIGGSRRFGYNLDCSELIEEEATTIRDAYARIIAGESIVSIKRHWETQGIKGARGGTMSLSNIIKLLRRPMNAGYATYKGEIVGKSQLPSIVSPAIFKKALLIMDSASFKLKIGRPPKAMLSPFLHCDKCKAKMGRLNNKEYNRPNKIAYIYYACPTRCRCVRLEFLDAYVGARLLDKIAKDIAKVKAPVKITKATPAHEVEAAKWRDELADLQRMFAAGELSAKMFGPAAKAAEDKLAALEKLTAKAAGKPATEALTKGKDIYAAWAALDDEGRRAVIREHIEKIVVGAGVRGEPENMVNVFIDPIK